MDLLHLKNSELAPQYQKYKGRVVLRGDSVKDDSGSYAVFTEQGSPASQITAAKVMHIFQDFQDAQDKQRTQCQLTPRSKWKMHHYCWKFQRLPKRKWPKPWSSMEDPVVPLERNLYGHPLAGLLWRRQSEKVLLEHGWEKFQIGNAYSLTETKGLFFSVYVDGIKLAGTKQNIDPMWKILMKDVDFGEPTSFLDHVYLGCTQRVCQTSEDIVDNYRNMFESRISAGAVEKLPETRVSGKPDTNTTSSWSYDMERSCKEVRGKILRTGEQNNSTVTHSRNSMYWRPSIQGRRNGICWRNVWSLLTNCSETLVFGSYW